MGDKIHTRIFFFFFFVTRNQHILGNKVFPKTSVFYQNQVTDIQPYIALKCICLVFDTFQCICVGWCLFVVPGSRKCLKQSFHYEINKERGLLQYMNIKIFAFYLPYIPKKNQKKNISHAISTKTAKHFY